MQITIIKTNQSNNFQLKNTHTYIACVARHTSWGVAFFVADVLNAHFAL